MAEEPTDLPEATPSTEAESVREAPSVTAQVERLGLHQPIHRLMHSAGLIDDDKLKWLDGKQVELVADHLVKEHLKHATDLLSEQKISAGELTANDELRAAKLEEARAMATAAKGMPKGFQLGTIATTVPYENGKPLVTVAQSNALLAAQAAGRMAAAAESGVAEAIRQGAEHSDAFRNAFMAANAMDNMVALAHQLDEQIGPLSETIADPQKLEALKGLKAHIETSVQPARQELGGAHQVLGALKNDLLNAKPWIEAEQDPVVQGLQAGEALAQDYLLLLRQAAILDPEITKYDEIQKANTALGNLATLSTYVAAAQLHQQGMGSMGEQMENQVGWALQSPPNGFTPEIDMAQTAQTLRDASLAILEVNARHLITAGATREDFAQIAGHLDRFTGLAANIDRVYGARKSSVVPDKMAENIAKQPQPGQEGVELPIAPEAVREETSDRSGTMIGSQLRNIARNLQFWRERDNQADISVTQ